uniref:Glycosyltransferase n=1 Tax=uncultured bacterium Contig248 TaxID=1393544 RepID=W0FIC0_9BACT|nr:conserved hypothetical protein [uncultured bacterium Contig248]
MKTYVFITRRICEIGGAEIYIYNKMRFLESEGWRVLIFSARHGKVLIRDFQKHEKLIFPALECCPECFSKREVKKVIDRITAEIGDTEGDPCILESNSAIRAVWAELIAEKLNCRHLAFVLQESHRYDAAMKDFLTFKYQRHELRGITEDSVGQMIGEDRIDPEFNTKIFAYCNNSIVNCDDPYSGLLDGTADYTFASIGRLVKPCVLPIVEGFRAYFKKYPEKRFNLVMIGEAPQPNREEAIRGILSDCANVNLVMTGNIYPIPLSFVKNVDVFVSTAGSAGATYRAGRPTVKVHPTTGDPIGIIGLDYFLGDKTMYDASGGMTIEDCIERALRQAGEITYDHGFDEAYEQKLRDEFARQLSFVDETGENGYYNSEKLMCIRTQPVHSHKLQRTIGRLFGSAALEKVKALRKKKGDS